MSLFIEAAPTPTRPLQGEALVRRLEDWNLLGRGGAGFPVARKWRSVRERAHGNAVVLANGAEGEPLSRKDRTLMVERPDLVIDGGLLAAQAVGARDIIFYLGAEHRNAIASMRSALARRPEAALRRARLVEAPPGYVSGEESAAVHFVNDGDARPTTTPSRPFERGVDGKPTLVQNVESLAMAASIARGDDGSTSLVTASGAVRRGGVYEMPFDASVAEVAGASGGTTRPVQAVLLGGYFGNWAPAHDVWPVSMAPSALRSRSLTLGCGVLHFLGADTCGVDATARVMTYLASQSARQCGPCVFGLGAIAAACDRLADRSAQADDLRRLARWSGEVAGRGACKHPDGASQLLRSALRVFADDLEAHQHRRCLVTPVAVASAWRAPVEAVA
ncbi:MAG TPA: NADH-ubiquinone oxidoreductase-F iron-sulfur binding region domain-containing protein [Candidatus Dormibacteraeota bacterium]|nr:NADH-ubiquinone oxidoreductase-F iron-sulfur binding region domain-containing protein [Candidatus Dormibacteraeota bacterium]